MAYSMQKTYTCRFLLLCAYVSCISVRHIEDTCQDEGVTVGNSTGYRNLQRLLSHSLDFTTKVDTILRCIRNDATSITSAIPTAPFRAQLPP
ncbi:hypothetical protein RB195_003379 [Necator americanus]|uniref:Uncharacterized protein n=1 Tax=Necator americanus TaxID=51031 RepID=A0ABR1DNA9_NECAM